MRYCPRKIGKMCHQLGWSMVIGVRIDNVFYRYQFTLPTGEVHRFRSPKDAWVFVVRAVREQSHVQES